MGGELDATNILNNQTVSVIAKIARDHETFLGNSLAGIAKHKAGILRPNVPYIIHPLNEPNVQHVIKQCATEIGAGPLLTGKSKDMRNLAYRDTWHRFAKPLLPFQRENAVLAVVAVKEVIKSLGLEYDNAKIGSALVERMWKPNPGRLQHTRVEPVFDEPKGRRILVDGAHNPDAAKALRDYVWKHERRKPIKGLSTPRDGWPVTWVLAMTEGKDARQYLETLLAPEDNVVTTSFGPVDGMPWVKAMDPKQLLDVARSVYPEITGIHIPEASPLRALCAAKHLAYNDKPIVLTGSLYLIGDFHRDLRAWRDRKRRSEFEIEEREPLIREMEKMDKEERSRVNQVLSLQDPDASVQITDTGNIVEESRKRDFRERRRLLQEELDAVNQEIARLRDEQSERMMHAPFSSPEIATTQTPKIGKPNKPAFRIRKHMTVLHPDLTMHAPFSKTRKLKKGTVRIRTHLTGNEKLPVIRQIDTELTAETRARVMSYRALSDLRTAS
jgi:folylpolyglutamate synthase/dihydrofolate synthase